jgi:hypothetical protein
MHRFYNPFTQVRSEEKASVWMYSASIEAVNAVLSGLKKQQKAGNSRALRKVLLPLCGFIG